MPYRYQMVTLFLAYSHCLRFAKHYLKKKVSLAYVQNPRKKMQEKAVRWTMGGTRLA